MGTCALPFQTRSAFAEAGTGGDESAIADGAGVAHVQREDLVGGELGDAVAVGFEIVDEEEVRDAEAHGQLAAVEESRAGW